jgi:outer membrane lipoprotein
VTGRNRLLQQIAALFTICLLAGSVAAAEVSAPTRDETLSGDLDGPAVDWVGEIIRSVRDDGDTCFLLRRIDGGDHFIACGAGAFEPSRFAAGRTLEVQGNLGPAMARQIAGEIFTEPVVAGAFIRLLPVGSPYYWPPGWYYDPFYYPYYGPYWGPGLHWWYWH